MLNSTLHILPDLLRPGLRLVVCGSAVGTASAKAGAYYAGQGNRFWSILASTGLTPRELIPSEFRELLTYGIGLTDLVKSQQGNDDAIAFGLVDRRRLGEIIRDIQPQVLCFNGKRSAKEFYDRKEISYGLQPDSIGVTRLFVAPSTSGAARRAWDAGQWKILATLAGARAA